MYALIPCPEPLVADIKNAIYPRATKNMEGFWLVSQDPSMIAQVGQHAVCAESLEGLREAVDQQFKLPYGFTRMLQHSVRCYGWNANHRTYSYGADTEATLKAKRDFATKCVHNDDEWQVFTLISAPFASIDKKLHDLDILAEAKTHPEGIITDQFKVQDTDRIEVLKDEFILKYTILGVHVMYDPKRAKRLLASRQRNHAVGRTMPKKSAYTLLLNLVRELRDIVQCDTIRYLYYERWSCRGMSDAGVGITHFFDLAKRLGKAATTRRRIASILRELWIHHRLLTKNCTPEFRNWYEAELKRAGGPPKDTKKYMQKVKSQ